jgi:hypothetical protein
MEPRRNVTHRRWLRSIEVTLVAPRRYAARTTCKVLVVLAATAAGCGGKSESGGAGPRDAAADVTADGGSTGPFSSAGMVLLTKADQEKIESETCYQTRPVSIEVDAGSNSCSYSIPDANSAPGGCSSGMWAGCTAFVITLKDGRQYRVQEVSECSAGGIHPDPGNYSSGAVLCPSACAVLMEEQPTTLTAYELICRPYWH